MENTTMSNRQRKFYLVLPALVVPFVIGLFIALGGGGRADAQDTTKKQAGINAHVPGARLKGDTLSDKLTFYQQAEKDSLKRLAAQKDDPNYKDTTRVNRRDSLKLHDTGIIPQYNEGKGTLGTLPPLNTSRVSLATNEQRINAQLATLNRQINQPPPVTSQPTGNTDDQAAKLQAEMRRIGSSNNADPQMAQLSDMLEKIQEIQNPGLVQQKLRQQSQKNRGEVFAVGTGRKDNPVSTLDNSAQSQFQLSEQQNGFYSFDNGGLPADTQNAIEAVVHETQTLTAGSTIKLRLANDVYINGNLIPKDNFVFGTASLNGERLTVKISSIRYHNSIYPVDLSVYDLDGANGIYIPGAITRDVAKESADQGIQSLGLTSYDPSLGAQAATAGISAAKTLFSRKVRLVKVTVKAGYLVLLRDEKQKQNN